MIAGWVVGLSALIYGCALFGVAHFGDTTGRRLIGPRARTTIYALSLGVYCTSWTFFGSVGFASTSGFDFLTIYVGPFVVLAFCRPFLVRIVRLTKAQNITSVADFVGARYGKSEMVAALVVVIMIVGVVPYVALQLKAISAALATMTGSLEAGRVVAVRGVAGEGSLAVAFVLAAFAMAFGTRSINATEHHDGLMLAVAAESVVKLVAFLAVGVWTTFVLFDGPGDLLARAAADPAIAASAFKAPEIGQWLAVPALSACAIVLLPRQFHVMVVENRRESDLGRAGWLFPVYLVLINLFVAPIAVAGLATFAPGAIDRDMTVLALPLHGGAGLVSLLAMIGGLSAATAMVVVACVALSIMASNDLVMPLVLRWRAATGRADPADGRGSVLAIRRIAILAVVLLGYGYFRLAGDAPLADIGLLSFAAVAQVAPAFLGALFWRRANARGAMAGLCVGAAVWVYTLLLPSLDVASEPLRWLLAGGPFGVGALRPTALFGLAAPMILHGVAWSLGLNVLAFVAGSLGRRATPMERLQADLFMGPDLTPIGQSFRLFRASVTAAEVETLVARYVGAEPTRRALQGFLARRGETDASAGREADAHLVRFAENLLASAIGAASSRLVMSLYLRRRIVSRKAALRLVDDASAAIQYNRDLLQHALDHVRQGITVFDRDLRLMGWNRAFCRQFDLPPDMMRVGVGLDEIVAFNAARGLYGAGPRDEIIMARLESLLNETEPMRLTLRPSGDVIEVRSARLPDGGVVTIFTDVTTTVAIEHTLEVANETLERRVRERTEELERLNEELARAKAEAEEANVSKTRFLAAASHDILQPLNAARLYASALVERTGEAASPRAAGLDAGQLARNVDASLDAVEEILTALLDISRLDAGAMKPETSVFRIDDILSQLKLEFAPMARAKGLDIAFVPSSASVRSDRRLLRRLLQNLVSNAIKYTPAGKVLVGCRLQGRNLRVEVFDTGLGIPKSQHKRVFQEFQRLDPAVRAARGLGLGLSIVQRLSRVLGHRIALRSREGRGSLFSVVLPLAAAVPAAASVESDAGQRRLRPLVGLTVLAIDNEPRILEGMESLLSGWGCTVVTAADLREAETALLAARRAPDAVVADYHLESSNGIEAVTALRWRHGADLPAVLVTADRTPQVRDEAAAKHIHVLHKPLKPAALRALLTQWSVTRATAAE